MIMLIKLTITIALGLFAAAAFIECAEEKRIRRERLRVQAVVKKTYPRVY